MYGQSFDVPTDDDWVVPIGRANVVRGKRCHHHCLFDHGRSRAGSAEQLAQHGISAEVIDLRTIRPLDTETIVNSVKKTSRLVTCEEGFPFAGVGSEIAMQVMEQAFDWLDAPIARVTGKDVPMPYAAISKSWRCRRSRISWPRRWPLVKASGGRRDGGRYSHAGAVTNDGDRDPVKMDRCRW